MCLPLWNSYAITIDIMSILSAKDYLSLQATVPTLNTFRTKNIPSCNFYLKLVRNKFLI